MSLRAVIWDLGGVLVRTEDLSIRERLADRLGTPPGAGESGLLE